MTEQGRGSLAEEAALLLDAVSGRLSQARETVDGGVEVAPVCAECGRPGDSCTACPWCRIRTTLRSQRPEVTLALLDALAAAVTAVRAILPDGGADPSPTAPAAGNTAPQRIPIT